MTTWHPKFRYARSICDSVASAHEAIIVYKSFWKSIPKIHFSPSDTLFYSIVSLSVVLIPHHILWTNQFWSDSRLDFPSLFYLGAIFFPYFLPGGAFLALFQDWVKLDVSDFQHRQIGHLRHQTSSRTSPPSQTSDLAKSDVSDVRFEIGQQQHDCCSRVNSRVQRSVLYNIFSIR